MDILLAFVAGFIWLRVFILLRMTRTFGPLIKIIVSMITDFGVFFVLWGTQLLMFSCMGTLLFADSASFDNFYDAFIMLFQAALGSWDMSIFANLSIA